jgi:hypothetical protein
MWASDRLQNVTDRFKCMASVAKGDWQSRRATQLNHKGAVAVVFGDDSSRSVIEIEAS